MSEPGLEIFSTRRGVILFPKNSFRKFIKQMICAVTTRRSVITKKSILSRAKEFKVTTNGTERAFSFHESRVWKVRFSRRKLYFATLNAFDERRNADSNIRPYGLLSMLPRDCQSILPLDPVLKRVLSSLSAADPDSRELRLRRTTRSAWRGLLSEWLSPRESYANEAVFRRRIKALQHPGRGISALYKQYAYPWFMPETPHLNVATTFIGLYANLRNLRSVTTICPPHAPRRFHLMHTTRVRVHSSRASHAYQHDVTLRSRAAPPAGPPTRKSA